MDGFTLTDPQLILLVDLLALVRLISYVPALVIALKDRNWLVIGVIVFLYGAIIANSFFQNIVVWALFGSVGSVLNGVALEKYLRLKRDCDPIIGDSNGHTARD